MEKEFKQLTEYDLIRGNIKNRGSEYRSLVIGVVLAISFISLIVILISSVFRSNEVRFYEENSNAHLYMFDIDENELSTYQNSGVIDSYGINTSYAYFIGEGPYNNFSVSSLDETSLKLLYLNFLEGRAPSAAGEIVLEEEVLRRVEIEPELGDTISIPLFFYDNAGERIIDQAIDYEFTLVGIVEDKNVNLKYLNSSMTSEFKQDFPYAYVSEFLDMPDGAVPVTTAYVELNESSNASIRRMDNNEIHSTYDAYYIGYRPFNMQSYEGDLVPLAISVAMIALALLLASTLAISNSITAVLNSRERQIALMRAIGASKSQLFSIYAQETLVISIIALPLGLVVSALLTYVITIFGPDYLFVSINIYSIIILVVLSILIVFISSLIPLRRAVNIPPMQAIRNVDLSRKISKDKLRSKKSFKPVKLIARRNIRISYKSFIGISLFVGICLAMVVLATNVSIIISEQINYIEYDFAMHNMNSEDYVGLYYDVNRPKFNENDLNAIRNLPQFDEIEVSTRLELAVPVDEIEEYFSIGFRHNFPIHEIEHYDLLKEFYGYSDELLLLNLYIIEENELANLSAHVVDGEINSDNLNSGEEVIVVFNTIMDLPPSSSSGRRGYKASLEYSSEESIENAKYYIQDYFHSEDTIQIDYIYTEEPYPSYLNMSELPVGLPERSKVNIHSNTPKIQAYVNVEEMITTDFLPESGIYTTLDGLRNMNLPVEINEIQIALDRGVSESTENYIVSELEAIGRRYQGNNISIQNYIEIRNQDYVFLFSLMTTVFTVIIILLSICISVVNNNISARIKSSQRVIGTLRAVGMDRRKIKRSYNLQIIYYFLVGGVLGIVLGVLVSQYIIANSTSVPMDNFHILSILLALAFLIVMILVSSVSASQKLNRIIDKDIVQNIRTF